VALAKACSEFAVAHPQTIFKGTLSEAAELEQAIKNNCACKFRSDGALDQPCAPHVMMVIDQKALDHLLFMKHLAGKLNWRDHVA
jgi:hypothetical protein